MDAYILTKLDQLRDTQRDHGEILRRLEVAVAYKSQDEGKGFLAKLKLPLSLQKIVASAFYSGMGLLLIRYLTHGGDAITAIEILLKLL